jgi:hypothetical protein
MRRYNEYDRNGTGFSPLKKGDALPFGIALHACMERVMRFHKDTPELDFGAEWENTRLTEVVDFAKGVHAASMREDGDEARATHRANEQAFLLEMLVWGWTMQRLPRLLEEYTIESLEQEFEVSLVADVKLMVRLDAVLRNKANNLPYILDFKSLSTINDDWMVKQEHSAQTSLYIYAFEQHTGEYCGGIMYEGFVKGAQREEKNPTVAWQGARVQVTPLCYVYTNDATGEVKHEYTKAKGWRKAAAWHLNQAADHYCVLRGLYEGDLPQFCVVPPVRPPQAALDRTVKQTIVAEREYYVKLTQINGAVSLGQEERAKELEDALFELHYGTCYKYGGSHHCPFTGVCHGGARLDDPELFTPRVPHHPGEFEDE